MRVNFSCSVIGLSHKKANETGGVDYGHLTVVQSCITLDETLGISKTKFPRIMQNCLPPWSHMLWPWCYWAIPEKIQIGGVEDTLFWKAPWKFKIWHFIPRNSGEKKLLPLKILQICVTPLGNSKVKNKTHGNSLLVFLEHPWNFHFFFNWPLEFPHVFSSRPP